LTSLKLELSFPSNKQEKIIIRGHANRIELINVLKDLDMDYTEYGIDLDNIEENTNGIIQIFSLYCLHQKLLQESGENIGYS
jgi:hypothetical protein